MSYVSTDFACEECGAVLVRRDDSHYVDCSHYLPLLEKRVTMPATKRRGVTRADIEETIHVLNKLRDKQMYDKNDLKLMTHQLLRLLPPEVQTAFEEARKANGKRWAARNG